MSTTGSGSGATLCRYLDCARRATPVHPGDPTARWPLCPVHRPMVREALAGADGSRLAVREIEADGPERRLLVGPA